MHQWRKRIAIILAAWTLLVSVGFTVNSHWCGDSLRDWAIFSSAEPCAHQAVSELPPCHQKKMAQVDAKGCCHEESTHVQSFDEEAPVPVHKATQFFTPLFNLVRNAWRPKFIVQAREDNSKAVAESPPPKRNIPVFIQSFRI